MKITKKRKYADANPIKVEVKEENTGGNDYLMAKGRLNSVLKQLTEQSDSDQSSSDDNSYRKSFRKRKDNPPTPYHHTYVMKLFDRSVDLAQFEEDTPLYPICRAWMKNQPRNPQAVVKRRVSSPEPEHQSWNGNFSDINRLPPPSEEFQKRIPSPLPCQEQNKDDINLDYNEAPPVPQYILIKDHLQRWAKVRKHWNETAAKNESRYAVSTQILKTIYNRAREEMEI
ncbi:protein lin-37 homolog isoform X2 [Coccinella septempunctata]|uniref:protein lin-37 homolog isoform X2 n=1 Tax=Coccinella septempunctata TaxID=41139 RepID=UPI001D096BEE|nr:protein lin-37 homolog isoform X2 [Coccinella septempunctata]